MKGDFHVRFRENLRVKLPWVTRLITLVYKPSGFPEGFIFYLYLLLFPAIEELLFHIRINYLR